jgi:hypothetical protein
MRSDDPFQKALKLVKNELYGRWMQTLGEGGGYEKTIL